MLIKNVHVNNQPELVDVAITDGKFTAIEAGLTPKPGEQVIEGNGTLLLPPFIGGLPPGGDLKLPARQGINGTSGQRGARCGRGDPAL